MIRVVLPYHLRNLAKVGHEVDLHIEGEQTIAAVVQTLESTYPMLQGTIVDHSTGERRPFIRFFACGEDFSLEPINTPLPSRVIDGQDPLRIVGAMAGG